MLKYIKLARHIQKTFLPESLPQIEGWNLDLRWSTAREVGGDFYDVFKISDDKIAFAIADVSDKGMPAALYMTVTRTLIRSSAQNLHSPAKILSRVNELLALENPSSGMFVTAVLGVLDPKSGDFEYAIAGHNLPLLRRGANGEVENLKKGGIAMSVIENAEYEDHCTVLKSGDSLLLYTDGVTETFSPGEEAFTESRLIDAFKKAYSQKKLSSLEYIEEKLAKFRGKQPLSDDITMIHIQKV